MFNVSYKDRTVFELEELELLTRRQVCATAATGLVALAVSGCVGQALDGDGVTPGGGAGGTAEPPGGPGGGIDPGTGGTIEPGGTGSGGEGGPTGSGGASGGSGGRPVRDAGRDRGRLRDAGASSDAGSDVDAALSVDARPPATGPGPGAACGNGTLDTGMAPQDFAMSTATFFAKDRLFVCRDAGGLYALTAVCPHAGCNVRTQGRAFRCPCHGSAFDFTGGVTQGPARSPLRHFALCLDDGGNLRVDTGRTVDRAERLT
jgi:nitrite reductase/ring-hydroxylating ferredoxin subunit